MKKTVFLLLLPLILAWFAYNGFGFVFKAGVPLSCVFIIGFIFRDKFKMIKSAWYVIAALLFSIAGDWFLSFKGDSFIRFAIGIGFYFFAHVGYLGFALANGRIHKIFTGILLAGYLLFFFFLLYPTIAEPVLLVAVLLYLLISCITLGAAAGVQLKPVVKWSYFLGITLILFSDTIIAFHEFTAYQEMNFLILPTYYAAHIFVTFSLIEKSI